MPVIDNNPPPSASVGESSDISKQTATTRQTGVMSPGEKFKYAIGVAGSKVLGTAAGVAAWMPGGAVVASALGQGAGSFNSMAGSASASLSGMNRGATPINTGDNSAAQLAQTSVGGSSGISATNVSTTMTVASAMTAGHQASFGTMPGANVGIGLPGTSIGMSTGVGAGAGTLPTASSASIGGASAGTTAEPLTGGAISTGSGSQDALLQATQQMQETQMSFNLQYLQLQNSMQNENRQFTMVSNIMKTKHDTAKNTISNVH